MQRIEIWLPALSMALTFVCVAALFWSRYKQHKEHGVVFAQLSPDRIRFHETGASGCSHKTTFTRFGGASRCLQVTVTDDEVWIRTGFPFNVCASQVDLEHRISRASVLSVQPSNSGRSLLLDYRDQQGQTRRLSLVLQKADDFLRVLGYQRQTV